MVNLLNNKKTAIIKQNANVNSIINLQRFVDLKVFLVGASYFLLVSLYSCNDNSGYKKRITYYPSGKIRYTEYLNPVGKRDSIFQEYYDSIKVVHFSTRYRNGIKNGKSFSFFKNGKIESERSFINDSLEGESLFYYSSGLLKLRINFRNNHENGYLTEYYESSGAIEAKELYVNDTIISHAYLYYPNGSCKKYTCYSLNGNLGHVTIYNENGSIRKDTGAIIINYSVFPNPLNLNVDSIENFRIAYALPLHTSGQAFLKIKNKNGVKIAGDMTQDVVFFSKQVIFYDVGDYQGEIIYAMLDSLSNSTKKERIAFDFEVIRK